MTTKPSPSTSAATNGRRTLRFDNLDQVLADVDRLAAAEGRGTLRSVGAWTFGQNLHHLATWVDYSYDGAPMRPPLVLRLILRPMKRRFLNAPMPTGVRIPRVSGGTFATEAVPSDEGLQHFRASLERLKREAPAGPHMIFGRLTHEEWIKMHLRHCELHLSFLNEGG